MLAAIYLMICRSPVPKRIRNLADHYRGFAGVGLGFPLFTGIGHANRWMPPMVASCSHCCLCSQRLQPSFLAVNGRENRFFFYAALGTLTVLAFVLMQSQGQPVIGDLHLIIAAAFAAMGYAAGGALSRKRPGLEVLSWSLLLCLPLPLLGLWLTWPANIRRIRHPSLDRHGIRHNRRTISGLSTFSIEAWRLGGIAKVGQIQLLQVYMTMVDGRSSCSVSPLIGP